MVENLGALERYIIIIKKKSEFKTFRVGSVHKKKGHKPDIPKIFKEVKSKSWHIN